MGKVLHKGWGIKNTDFISNKNALNAALRRSIGVSRRYLKRCILDISS